MDVLKIANKTPISPHPANNELKMETSVALILYDRAGKSSTNYNDLPHYVP